MLAPVAVTFYTFALAVHIASIVIAFGVTFAYPVMYVVGIRSEPATMPGFHRIQDSVGKFVISPFLGLALLAGIYLFFAVDAIFVSGVGPLAAIQRSVAVVRRHLWPTLGLVLLTWLILAGMDRVWAFLADALRPPFGVGLSMLANTYIASGLLAASMIFYYERAARD
jgi:hypothetical protein